jgi:116 kDa U5 small nuclear ribonucleoprotein component
MSLVLPSSSSKSYLINILDTPGHVNFEDEVAASLRLCDGAILVVDVAEGVLLETQRVVRYIVSERKASGKKGMGMVLVVNKMDRLILELRLPPQDAYFKIRHTIEEVNTIIRFVDCRLWWDVPVRLTIWVFSLVVENSDIDPDPELRLSPEKGNVVFASTSMGWAFTLESFAKMYRDAYGGFFGWSIIGLVWALKLTVKWLD